MRAGQILCLSIGLGLTPKYVLEDAIDVQWKLYELKGRFYIGRPKDGSIRMADLPPFLAALLAEHLDQVKGRQCACRERPGPAGPDERTRWCAGAPYVFLASGGGHYQRSNYGEVHFRPAADGWHPETSGRSGRPVLVDAGGIFPGGPLTSWPAALPGEAFTPPRGRGIPRYLSDEKTGRCPACGRAQVRRAGGRLITHKANGDRCPGSAEFPGEDLALASWLPVSKGLTPHGLRHGHRVWMEMGRIASEASFGIFRERWPPAAQHAALGQARGNDGLRTMADLGCHHPLASGLTMMQPVRLRPTTA